MRETKDVWVGEPVVPLAETDGVRDAALPKQTLARGTARWPEIEDFSQSHQSQTPSHNSNRQLTLSVSTVFSKVLMACCICMQCFQEKADKDNATMMIFITFSVRIWLKHVLLYSGSHPELLIQLHECFERCVFTYFLCKDPKKLSIYIEAMKNKPLFSQRAIHWVKICHIK